jgi:hypothetical protein
MNQSQSDNDQNQVNEEEDKISQTDTTMPVRNRAIAPINLQSYDGRSMRFEVFWTQCVNAATHNGWDDDTLKRHIVGNLKGDAANQLSRLTTDVNFSLQQLKAILERQFGTRMLAEEALRKLSQYQQLTSHSYLQMSQEIQDLISLAHPNWPEDLREEETVRTFIEALRDEEVRKEVRRIYPTPTTLEEVIKHAERLLRVQSLERYNRRGHIRQMGEEDPEEVKRNDYREMRNYQPPVRQRYRGGMSNAQRGQKEEPRKSPEVMMANSSVNNSEASTSHPKGQGCMAFGL